VLQHFETIIMHKYCIGCRLLDSDITRVC